MIIAGIALFAVGEVGMNWKTLSTDLTTGLLTILQDISPYIAILGLILLCVPGMQAVGAGMLAAGIGAFVFYHRSIKLGLYQRRIKASV